MDCENCGVEDIDEVCHHCGIPAIMFTVFQAAKAKKDDTRITMAKVVSIKRTFDNQPSPSEQPE